MIYGVFGGAFDPPHISHVLACLWALETAQVQRVVLIPCARHPLGKQPRADFAHRLAMCRLAVGRLEREVEVLDMEASREGASYTIDTLRALQAQRPGHQWRLMIGTDILSQTAQWKDWDQIELLAPPLVIPRLTAEADPGQASHDLRCLSSTHLRESLARDLCPDGLLPRSVLDYIRANHLYGMETDPRCDT